MPHVPGHEDTTTARLPRTSQGLRAARESLIKNAPLTGGLQATSEVQASGGPAQPLRPSQQQVGTRQLARPSGQQRVVDIPRGDVSLNRTTVSRMQLPFLGRTQAPGEAPEPFTVGIPSTFTADFDPDAFGQPDEGIPPRIGLGINFPSAATPTDPAAIAAGVDPSGQPDPFGTRQTPLISGTGDDLTLTGRFARGNTPEEAADIVRGSIARGGFRSATSPTGEPGVGGGLRSRVSIAGGGVAPTEPPASPTIADLLSGTSDVNLGGLQAAGALSTDLFNRRQQGIRNRQEDRRIGAAETTAATGLAKALTGKPTNISDKLKGLGDVKIVPNPVSGTADLQVGNSLIPEALRPQWENFAANVRLTPEFIAAHGNKSPAEQDRIAARDAAEFMEEQGVISSGAARPAGAAIATAFGG